MIYHYTRETGKLHRTLFCLQAAGRGTKVFGWRGREGKGNGLESQLTQLGLVLKAPERGWANAGNCADSEREKGRKEVLQSSPLCSA